MRVREVNMANIEVDYPNSIYNVRPLQYTFPTYLPLGSNNGKFKKDFARISNFLHFKKKY